jgi:hypothetical protein
MNTPEDYILEALEIVSTWDLPDDESVIQAANQQARLMSGQFDIDSFINNVHNMSD